METISTFGAKNVPFSVTPLIRLWFKTPSGTPEREISNDKALFSEDPLKAN